MKWVIGFSVLALVAGLWWTGALEQLSNTDRLRALVEDAGMAGPFVFIGLVVLLFPVFLAGPPIWLSGTIWPIPLAILYSAVASTVASVLFYGVARYLGHEWAAERIPEKVRRYEERLEQHPLRTLVLLRLLLWINPAVDILAGVSNVSTRSYLIGSAIALFPLTFVHVILPAKGVEFAGAAPDWLGPAVLAAIVIVGAVLFARRRSAANRSGPPG